MEMIDNLLDFVNRNRRNFQLLVGVLIALLIAAQDVVAQRENPEGFIYGKVYTRDNQYQGQIRWGKEEAYWHDHFNASKVENPYSKLNDRYRRNRERDEDSWRDIDWRLSSIWEDKAKTVHQFGCQFGDIQQLENYGGKRMLLQLKNGEEIELSGSGYNDGDATINIYDDELGKVSINWDRIEKVEFLPTPKNLQSGFGAPVYGKVDTYRKGVFEGFVIWDHDERMGDDKLDGDTRDGDVSITFDNIKRIERKGNGSIVNIKSGREFYLTGSNDVNNGNRGIIVMVDGVGKVDIPWRDFISVDFEDGNGSGRSYADYNTPRGLKGKVIKYSGGEVQGNIVFDLDEALEIEFLEGKDDELEYNVPFRNIKSIAPKNYNFSTVKFRNGTEVLLGNGRDVSESNAGILVYDKNRDNPQYIEWRNITEIIFD